MHRWVLHTARLVGLLVVLVGGAAASLAEGERPAGGGAVAATQTDQGRAQGASTAEISKAYMNCLVEADTMLAELALRAKQKAVKSESESQRAFCVNRKRDCLATPTSPECRTFIEEFRYSDLVDRK